MTEYQKKLLEILQRVRKGGYNSYITGNGVEGPDAELYVDPLEIDAAMDAINALNAGAMNTAASTMRTAKPCDDKCQLRDWQEFHGNLDVAMAHMIQDTEMLPSKTSILDLAHYSNQKRILKMGEDAGVSPKNN